MTWTAPPATRVDPPQLGGERATLDAFLDYHRNTLLWKCSGLTGEQLARRAAPRSTMSLLGLLRHLTDVERSWLRSRVAGQDVRRLYWSDEVPDGDFDLVDAANAEADLATYLAECELTRAAVADLPLEHTFVHPRQGETSLRWVYVHLIEEYARHNGHADLLRQAIDGEVGE